MPQTTEYLSRLGPWGQLRISANRWMARSGGIWLACLSLLMLITTPLWIEKALTNSMQTRMHRSALHYAQQLTTRLDAAQSNYARTLGASSQPREDFELITRQWLSNSPHVLAVQLLDAQGEVLKAVQNERQALTAEDPNAFKPLNRIPLANALELQTPTYSALFSAQAKQVVNLFIPHNGPSPVAYVLTLDTQAWTQIAVDDEDKTLSVKVVPFHKEASSDASGLYLNSPEWEGLWSLQFQSKDPMLGILAALRPAFFIITLILIGLFFLHWRNFQRQQQTDLVLQEKSLLLEKQSRLSMLGEMSASLAHEINQPLTSISNYAVAGQLQLHRTEPNSPLLPLLKKIHEQSQRAAPVLVAVRGMTHPGPMNVILVNVQDLLKRLEPHLQRLCAQHQVALQINCSSQWNMHINPILFEQVILNLVKNSIQAFDTASSTKKQIRMNVSSDNGMLLIEVADNGSGIAPDIVPRIFDSFFTTKPQGLGIGLKLCRSIIERFNGRLTLKSNSTEGACFLISLPLTNASSFDAPSE